MTIAGEPRPGSASVALEEGQSVLLVVSGYDGAQGDFALHVDRVAPPACPVDSIATALPQRITGDTWGLGDAVSTRCGSIDTPDASYSFTVPRAGRYIFDTSGSTFDTVLELRRGSCSGAMIACNDNGNDNAMEAETSRIVVNLAEGQTVVAVVDGIDGGSGPFTLNVSEYVPPPCPEFTLGTTFPQTVTGTTAVPDCVSILPSPCSERQRPRGHLWVHRAGDRALYLRHLRLLLRHGPARPQGDMQRRERRVQRRHLWSAIAGEGDARRGRDRRRRRGRLRLQLPPAPSSST